MNLGDMFSDKIKRLGGTLSPGQEVRIDFTESEKEEFGYELGCSKYTVLNVNDIEVPSAYYDETRDRFKRQLLIDHLKQYVATHKGEIPSWYKAPLNSLNENLKKKNADVKNYKEIKDDFNAQVEFLYSNKKYWKNVEKAYDDYLSKHERERDVYESMLESQMAPYKQITVSDA